MLNLVRRSSEGIEAMGEIKSAAYNWDESVQCHGSDV